MQKAKGNMYQWVTHTVNPLGGGMGPTKGGCLNDCLYCYMRRLHEKKAVVASKYEGKPRIWEKEMKGWGKGKTIFVQNCSDLFANDVPDEIIMQILDHAKKFDNTYLFQSKNPARILDFLDFFPPKTILCTTLETNREVDGIWSKECPTPFVRGLAMYQIRQQRPDIRLSITIEPIMDFDLEAMKSWVEDVKPEFMSIGADSDLKCRDCGYGKGEHDSYIYRGKNTCPKCGSENITNLHGIPEPKNADKIKELISAIKAYGVEVKIKDNLKRLCPELE